MGMFRRGFKAVNDEKDRQEENRKRSANKLFRFFLSNDKDEADVTFLTEQPVNYYEHNIKEYKNGKEYYNPVPCIGEGCKYCADGEKASFKSAWLIVDHREFSYKDKDGKQQTGRDQLRLLVYGTKIASQLDRKSERYGLMSRIYTIVRLGKGTSTTYTFEHGDKYTLTPKEIENILPDHIKDLYDGTTESFYSIIEKQIEMLVQDDSNETSQGDTSSDNTQEDLVNISDEEPKKRDLPFRSRKKSTVENNSKPSIKELLKNKK